MPNTMTITINKQEIAPILNQYYSSLLNELYLKEYKFQIKYKTVFELFAVEIEQKDEDFELWDDFIEWKAFRKSINNLEQKLNAIEHGTFAVA